MVVLDADSVMSGAAISAVRVMEAHPEIGILQQLIVGLPNLSPFPRIFQFGTCGTACAPTRSATRGGRAIAAPTGATTR